MTLYLYNTLTRKKEEFKPLAPANVRMYVCGPTVYDRAHLGNARSVVVYDVLYRLLKHLYPKVTYVRNITDVDDKINKAARERGISIQKLTQEVTGWFHEDMKALNVESPTIEPKATEHIRQMIDMIEKLIANGKAYVAERHVLFSVKSSPLHTSPRERGEDQGGGQWYYGILSGRVQEDLEAGARIKVESYKRDPNDFVLWKPADADDDPSSVFESPWGKGRPGWHIECSAMSTEYLGRDFDIHGGGSDLMFPHHENEIAQSCGAYPHSHFAHYWVHNGFLTVNGEKMSKSLGNFITVRELLKDSVGEQQINLGAVIRYIFLKTKYREPFNWNQALFNETKDELYSLYRKKTDDEGEEVPSAFIEALCDDLNTPKALSLLHLAKGPEINSMFRMLGIPTKKWEVFSKEGIKTITTSSSMPLDWLPKYGGALDSSENLIPRSSYNPALYDTQIVGPIKSTEDIIKDKIEARIAAKKAKNWAEADRIRSELKAQGIILEDRPDGTTDWRRE